MFSSPFDRPADAMQMTKKTKKLEKENTTIKTKCETMNKNILEMAEEVFYYFFLLFFLLLMDLVCNI